MKIIILLLSTIFSIQEEAEIYTQVLKSYFEDEVAYPDVVNLLLLSETYLPEISNVVQMQKDEGKVFCYHEDKLPKHIILRDYKELINKRKKLSIKKENVEYKFKIIDKTLSDSGRLDSEPDLICYYFSPIIPTTVKDEYLVVLTHKAGWEYVWHTYLIKKDNTTYKIKGTSSTSRSYK